MVIVTTQATRSGTDGCGRTRRAREHGRAAAERVRGRGRGGPTGGTATKARSAAREQEHRV